MGTSGVQAGQAAHQLTAGMCREAGPHLAGIVETPAFVIADEDRIESQLLPSCVERVAGQIALANQQEIERVVDDHMRGLMMQRLERWPALLVDAHELAVDNRRGR